MEFGQNVFAISEDDVILENEVLKSDSRYVIITQKICTGLDSCHPVISRTQFNDLRKHGMIYTSSELRRTACDKEKSTNVTYWKFKMDLIKRFYG